MPFFRHASCSWSFSTSRLARPDPFSIYKDITDLHALTRSPDGKFDFHVTTMDLIYGICNGNGPGRVSLEGSQASHTKVRSP